MMSPRMIESTTKPRSRHQNPAMFKLTVVAIGLRGARGVKPVVELAPELALGAPQDAQNRCPSTSWAPQTWQYATVTSDLALPPHYK
jgi:hypothetical protein